VTITNRDWIISYMTKRIDACLAQNPAVFPTVNNWLRATPGIVSDTNSGAPPVFIGWLNQVLYDAKLATSEKAAQKLGDSIVSMVKNSGTVVGVVNPPVGSAGLNPAGD